MGVVKAFRKAVIFCEIVFNKLSLPARRKTSVASPGILIIKIDSIGDYILFRNCLSVLKKSNEYSNCKITLLGNQLWKDIAVALDSDTIDDFIWLDYNRYKEFLYKKTFLSSISRRKFKEVIVFHYSRTLLTELLAFTCNAPVKTGMLGDFSLLGNNISRYTNKLYTRLISIPENCTHEFLKNRYLAQQLCGNLAPTESLETRPEIKLQPPAVEICQKKDYVVISAGAGDQKRVYPYHKMLPVVGQLFNCGYHLCFTGTTGDTDFVNTVKEENPAFTSKITDLTGKTTLVQMMHVINAATMVICNESSVYHLSIGLGTPVICFAGGGHFDRFANYGENKGEKLIYRKLACFNCNWNCIYHTPAGNSFHCIESIADVSITEVMRSMLQA